MSFAATLHWSPPEKRGQDRHRLAVGSTLHEAGGTAIDVKVENVSRAGVGLRSRQALPVGGRAWLGIPGLGSHEIEIVRRDGDFYGCRLDTSRERGGAGSSFADDTVVVGRFVVRAEALLREAVAPEAEIDRWPRLVRGGLAVGIPLILWFMLIGTWFFAW